MGLSYKFNNKKDKSNDPNWESIKNKKCLLNFHNLLCIRMLSHSWLQASLKFSFSEKATKICTICLMVLTFTNKCQNHKADSANFCGLFRKAELYHSRFLLTWEAYWHGVEYDIKKYQNFYVRNDFRIYFCSLILFHQKCPHKNPFQHTVPSVLSHYGQQVCRSTWGHFWQLLAKTAHFWANNRFLNLHSLIV